MPKQYGGVATAHLFQTILNTREGSDTHYGYRKREKHPYTSLARIVCNELVYSKERICIRQIGAVPIATIVASYIFTLNTIYNVYLKDDEEISLRFILGLINSKLIKYLKLIYYKLNKCWNMLEQLEHVGALERWSRENTLAGTIFVFFLFASLKHACPFKISDRVIDLLLFHVKYGG